MHKNLISLSKEWAFPQNSETHVKAHVTEGQQRPMSSTSFATRNQYHGIHIRSLTKLHNGRQQLQGKQLDHLPNWYAGYRVVQIWDAWNTITKLFGTQHFQRIFVNLVIPRSNIFNKAMLMLTIFSFCLPIPIIHLCWMKKKIPHMWNLSVKLWSVTHLLCTLSLLRDEPRLSIPLRL